MIHLITGVPGASKTLNAIKRALELQKEGRPVYQSGITDCRVPNVVELDDPTTWYELPPKSVLIIDEAQRFFRPRHYSSAVPRYVSELETHRHLGIDLIFVTQHPGLIDSNVRKLVGLHWHFHRKSWADVASRYEWTQCKGDVEPPFTDAISVNVPFDKELFGLYKSAEVHTVKKRLPQGAKYLAYGALAIIVCVAYFYDHVKTQLGLESPKAAVTAPSGPAKAKDSEPERARRKNYVLDRIPSVPGLEHTAPAYEGLIQPVRAPYPAACVATETRCGCWTQQATVLDVPDSLCRQIVARGFFVDWDDDRGRVEKRGSTASQKPLAVSEPVPAKAISPEASTVAPVAIPVVAKAGAG